MHMRPAMKFVDTATQFASDIKVSNGQIDVDGKSIMQMTMLAAEPKTILEITASGADCRQAADALRELVEDKMFDEPAATD